MHGRRAGIMGCMLPSTNDTKFQRWPRLINLNSGQNADENNIVTGCKADKVGMCHPQQGFRDQKPPSWGCKILYSGRHAPGKAINADIASTFPRLLSPTYARHQQQPMSRIGVRHITAEVGKGRHVARALLLLPPLSQQRKPEAVCVTCACNIVPAWRNGQGTVC